MKGLPSPTVSVFLIGILSAAWALAQPAGLSGGGSSANYMPSGLAPRIGVQLTGRFEGPPRLRFREVADTGRSQTLQLCVPPGPWRNAGLVPPSVSGVDAALPVPEEGVVLYRLMPSTNRTVVRQWFTGIPDSPMAVIPAPSVGAPWFLRGFAWTDWTQARVALGMMVDEDPTRQVTYLCQRLPGRPSRMEATVEWYPFFADGERESAFVMAACRDGGEEAWYMNCVHLRFHRDSVAVDVVEDGRFRTGLFVAVVHPALEPGVRHHVAMDLSGELIRVNVDGRTVLEGSEPSIDRLAGPAVFWELFSQAGRRRLSGAIHGLSAEVAGSGSGLSAGAERR